MKKLLTILILCLVCLPALAQKAEKPREIKINKYYSYSLYSDGSILVPEFGLEGAYDENELNADAIFKDKIIIVSGLVELVTRDSAGVPFVAFRHNSGSMTMVKCYFKDSQIYRLSSLSRNKGLIVMGKCAGLQNHVIMIDCQIIDR